MNELRVNVLQSTQMFNVLGTDINKDIVKVNHGQYIIEPNLDKLLLNHLI